MVFPLFVSTLRRRLMSDTAVVVQDHGGIHAGSPGFRRRAWTAFHRLGLRHADGFLFTAAALADPWRRAAVLSAAQPVHEVPESSTDLAPPSVEPGRERLPGRPAVLWVGRLDANKDPLTVLGGFERALSAIPDAALTFVYGEEQLLSEVRAHVSASPALATRVHLRGRIERRELAAVYAGADLFVLGSHHEGSSFALIEALSFGLTPVVSDIPSLRALTGDGRVGFLFPPGDRDGFGRAFAAAATGDLNARRRFVRAHFDRELSWPAVGRKALDVYGAAHRRRRG
jgi:glycosyltransferase involved in cell wall biosynthesis